MSDSESDLDTRSALPKRTASEPRPKPSHELKNKKTIKYMIADALVQLKTRKGVSLYAIKKFLTEKYDVDTEKVNYLIKKNVKAGVEDGSFIQMKGIGASGSFKLVNDKANRKKEKNKENIKAPMKMVKEKDIKKTEKRKIEKIKMPVMAKKPKLEKINKNDDKKIKKNKVAVEKEKKLPKQTSEKIKKKEKSGEEGTKMEKAKKAKVKTTKDMQTPAKKRAGMMKRKSIGSIIKKPKMKPAKN